MKIKVFIRLEWLSRRLFREVREHEYWCTRWGKENSTMFGLAGLTSSDHIAILGNKFVTVQKAVSQAHCSCSFGIVHQDVEDENRPPLYSVVNVAGEALEEVSLFRNKIC